MSTKLDNLGRPELESSDTPHYVSHISSSSMPLSLFPRMTADRVASLTDAMLMIDILMESWESQYLSPSKDGDLLILPNLLLEPTQGTQLKNKNTNEIYTIVDTVPNPVTGIWEGVIRINSITPPNPDMQEKLEFLTKDRLVRFAPEFSKTIGVESQTSDEMLIDAGPIRPTVSYALIKKEPGSIGKTMFGPQKQHKPRHIETIQNSKFAGHSIEIDSQWFDNLVEFGCFTTDNRSADQLADWFERFMRQNTWVLKKNGVQELVFFQRLRDSAVTKWRQDLISRAVQFFFRIEEILPVVHRNIRLLSTVINLKHDASEVGRQFIAGREITKPLTQGDYFKLFHDSKGNYLFGDISLNDENLNIRRS